MFRALIPSRTFLFLRNPTAPLTSRVTQTPGPSVMCDVWRSSQTREHRRGFLLPPTTHVPVLRPHPLLSSGSIFNNGQTWRWASDEKEKEKMKASIRFPNPTQIACNMINMVKCVDLNNMKDAPAAPFWVGVGVGGIQLILPFLEIIGGYSPVMTLFQLQMAAVATGFLGGTKYGVLLSTSNCPEWADLKWALLPPALATLGLAMPYPLGFLTVGTAMASSLYLDLKSCVFPPWYLASVFFTTLTTLIGLLLALSAYVLFHNIERDEEMEEDDLDEKDSKYEEERQRDNRDVKNNNSPRDQSNGSKNSGNNSTDIKNSGNKNSDTKIK